MKAKPEELLSDVVKRLDRGDPPPRDAGLFGGDPAFAESRIVITPIPWDHTASFGKGTSRSVPTLVAASHYLDFEDGVYEQPYRAGIRLLDPPPMASDWPKLPHSVEAINLASAERTTWLRDHTREMLRAKKIPGVLGGEHSVPLGAIQAIGEYYGEIGILHIDAHMDLRCAYEGYTESHASILYNAIESTPQIKSVVQVGIRDFSRE